VANPHVKYFKASFTGIYHVKEHTLLPFYQINHIQWEQLKFSDVSEIESYDFWEEQTNNSWSRKVVKPYKNNVLSKQIIWNWPKVSKAKAFPWIRGIKWRFPRVVKRTHVVLSVEENIVLSDFLHSVVLKRIKLLDTKDTWNGGFQRAHGHALFQLHLTPPAHKKKVTQPVGTIIPAEETNDLNLASIEKASSIGITDISARTESEALRAQTVSPAQQPLLRSVKGNIWWRIIMFLWLLFCLWKAPALIVPSLLLFGLIAFIRYFRKAALAVISSVIILGVLAIGIIYLLPNASTQQESVKTEDGVIKISPPKPNKEKDLISDKSITWWDFIQNKYALNYGTSATRYFESTQFHEQQFKAIKATNNLEFYGQLYRQLDLNDVNKLDSIVVKLKQNAKRKHLNSIQTAEMVCTFVQEIPYFLVHDFDCKTAVSESNSDFMVEYHRSNKPCLPEVPGGVQSPYEFMHNLKGDCDTRSLLAFTILRSMDIPASVWISEAYGHSVLGVGLPVSTGFYKEINGVKHYAVELTAKGFRLGMISPEQQVRNNWDIALFVN
jgi:hypothetical protein